MTRASRADAPPSIDRLFDGGPLAGQGDVALLGRFADGRDEGAFAALVARHGPTVRGACRAALRDPADVEDACQATFLILARRAGAIRLAGDGSLAPWLHRVARRVAGRAAASARRRRARERPAADLDAVPGPLDRGGPLADLREAIDRLPERYRHPLVLCELEGLTQPEAARALRCGEATVRRRLAAARARLRLADRGDVGALLAAARVASPSPPTLSWGRMAPSASALRLARQIGTLMMLTRLARTIAILAGLGTATAAVALHARPAPTAGDDSPAPAPRRPEPSPSPPPRWVHQASDTSGETWSDFATGREFRRDGRKVSLLEVAARDLFTFEGAGPIAKTKAQWYGLTTDKAGRPIPPSARAALGEVEPFAPRKATDWERQNAPVFWEQEFDEIEGRPCLRVDAHVRDALGTPRLDKQTWYDRATRRAVRQRNRLQVAARDKFGREFETIAFDYPATGPADLAALGVPAGTPVVDEELGQPSWNWADLPAEVRTALVGQAEAARRFPTDYRAVTAGWYGMLAVDYWSTPREFVDRWARGKTSDERVDLRENQPRHFRADNQDSEGRPAEIDRAVWPGFRGDLPADRIAAWLPLDRSVNVGLVDGRRTFHLTRTIQDDAGTRRVRLRVLSGEFDEFPGFVKDQWPLLNWDRSSVMPAPPRPDTPAGMVVIRDRQATPNEYRCEFTLDPARDFLAVRQVEWSNRGIRWYQKHTRATRLAQLPGGSWYVAEWERRGRFGGTPEEPGDPALLNATVRRVVVTPLRPDEFPPGIFDGEKFVADAREAGATIEVDR